jgi:ribosomal protein S1
LCCNIIKKECTNIKIFDTICNATCRRQQEAVEISQKADAVFVVGDKSSSNSVKLADICKQHSANVYFVQSAEDLNLKELSKYNVIGVTAGASTPASIIKEVTQKMSKEEIMDGTNTEDETIVEVVEDIQPEPEEVEVKITETPVEEKVEVINEPAVADEVVIETSIEEPATEPEAVVETTVEVVEDDEPAKDESDSDEETFEQMLEKSIKTIRTGERVTGVVTSITPTEVSLDLGTKQSGYIPIAELTDDENTDINDIIKIGDTIESFVMRVNDVEGMVMLSKKRFDAVRNWDYVEAAKDDKTIVSGVVIGENKGGIVVNVKGVHVFVPASQTGLPKTASMSELLKKPVKLRITEVNKSRRRVVGSIRMIQHDERREKTDKVWTDIEVGKQYDGIVKSMTTYDVFVDIGGVDGMIHISELSWTRIKQPSEVMSVGDEVSVYVISFDKDSRKISLGYKKGDDNPWTKFTSKYAIGDVISVKIVKMMPFGAFAEICPGVDGLIHISQIADHRIGLPSEVLSDGQIVDVKITEIDNERKKVSLSIRALLEATQQSPTTEEKAEEAEESKEAEETEKTEEAKESPQE